MKNFFAKLKALFVKHKFLGVLIVVAVIGLGWWGYGKIFATKATIQYVSQAVAKETITVTVSGSGQVSESNRIDLKPLNAGQVTTVNIKANDQVKAGQVLIVIDQKNNQSALLQAQSSLASARANYNKLVNGAAAIDIKLSQNSVNQAQNNYQSAVNSLASTKAAVAATLAQDQQTLANLLDTSSSLSGSSKRSAVLTTINGQLQSIKTGLDAANKLFNDSNAKNNLSAQNSAWLASAKDNYTKTQSLLPLAINDLSAAQAWPTDANLNQAAQSAIAAINAGRDSFNAAYSALQSSVTSVEFSQTQLDSYKSSINSQLTSAIAGANSIIASLQSLTDAITAAQNALANFQISGAQQITSAQNQVASALNSWQTAKDQLTKLKAPPTSSDLAVARAQLASAGASLQSAQDALSNNIITAPFAGVMAQLNTQIGDQVAASTILGTLITPQKQAVIPLNEVDVAKVKLNQLVNLTFDAVPDLTIAGKVVQIDQLGTVTQGVVTYNVKIAFDTQDERIKPGMSVSASIITAIATDVLAVPNAAVQAGANGSTVQVLDASNQPKTVDVQTGLANDTLTEITSGLNEGDNVVTQTITTGASTSAATNSSSGLRIPGLTGGAGANRGATGAGAFRGN